MNIYNLIPELTRRCNMRCDHCLRGDSENVDMSDKVMHRLISLLESYRVGSLTIGGGEFTTAPKVFNKFVEMLIWRRVYVDWYYMVTNTKMFPYSIKDSIRKLYGYVNEPDMARVSYSNDQFHELNYNVIERWHNFFQRELGFDEGFGKKFNFLPTSLLRMGRANNISESIPLEIYPYVIDENGVSEGQFYVNVYGEVFPDCNLSYWLQDNGELSLGNILDPCFNFIEAAERWNKIRYKDNTTFVVNEYELV